MQTSALSQAQGCLRLQSVYRAHRTRRCVTHRSRLEFERIVAELEAESSPPNVVFPLPFLCRPHVQRHICPAAAPAPAAAVHNNSAGLAALSLTTSSLATSSILSSPLQVGHSSSRAAADSFRTSSPSSSSPASPSAPLLARNSGAAANIPDDLPSATILSARIAVSAAENVGRPSPLHASHTQRQHTQDMPGSPGDAALPARPATADACVGDDDLELSMSFREHGGAGLQGSLSCHEDSFEDDCRQDGSSSSSSPCSRGSCDASHVSANIPLPLSPPVQLRFAEKRFFLLFFLALAPPLTPHHAQLQFASTHIRHAA